MTRIETFSNSSFSVQCLCVSGEPWFKGKEVARMLGYVNTAKAILNNVDDDDKLNLKKSPKVTKRYVCQVIQKTLYSLTSQVYIP